MLIAVFSILCGCGQQVARPSAVRAVSTITVERHVITETVTVTGQVRAPEQPAAVNAREAVFDIPAQLVRAASDNARVEVWLSNDPSVHSTGRVKEVTPRADAATRMWSMKVALDNPPSAMQLGASIAGRARLRSDNAFVVPGTALNEIDGSPAIWVVDPQDQTVYLRPVELLRYEANSAIISKGLQNGDVIVTSGVHALVPGQKVQALQATS